MMQQYQKTYFVGMGYDLSEVNPSGFFESELTGRNNAKDIHHIKFGEEIKRQNYPVERLIMLSRDEHTMYGDKKQWYDYLYWMHILKMDERKVNIDFSKIPESIASKDLGGEYTMQLNFFEHCKNMLWRVMIKDTVKGQLINLYSSAYNLIHSCEQETKLICMELLIEKF